MIIINQLKPFYINEKDKKIRMGNFKNFAKEIEYEDEQFIKIFENIQEPIEKDNLIHKIMNCTNYSKDDIENAIEYLISENFIIDVEEYNNLLKDEYYSRENLFFSMVSDKFTLINEDIAMKKILILGLGGIGSNVAEILSRAGFKNFILVDMDNVEKSNLIRQLPYNVNDIGKSKTKILKDKLLSNGKVYIKTINLKITGVEDIDKIINEVDFVICTLDKPSRVIRRIINESCIKNRKPVIFSGFSEHVAMIGPFVVPYKSACLKCIDRDLSDKPLNNVKIVPSYGPLCILISSIVSNEVINYYVKFNKKNLIGKTLMFDLINYKINLIKWKKKEKCEMCGDKDDSK